MLSISFSLQENVEIRLFILQFLLCIPCFCSYVDQYGGSADLREIVITDNIDPCMFSGCIPAIL